MTKWITSSLKLQQFISFSPYFVRHFKMINKPKGIQKRHFSIFLWHTFAYGTPALAFPLTFDSFSVIAPGVSLSFGLVQSMLPVFLKQITCFSNCMWMFLNKFLRKDVFLCFVPLGTTQPYVFKGWILFINEKEHINSSVQNAFFQDNTSLLLLDNCYTREHNQLTIIII